MFEYDRIDVSKGIDVNKNNGSLEYIICHYWYFFWKKKWRFDSKVCNDYHDVMKKPMKDLIQKYVMIIMM